MADEKPKGKVTNRSEGMPSGRIGGEQETAVPEPRTKLEADQATGVDPHPGNVSDLSEPVKREGPKRAEKLTHSDQGNVVGADVTERLKEGAKIGPGPGVVPKGPASTYYRYQVVVPPIGPDGDIAPGPDSAAITACIAAGYRPVGEASVEKVEDHPDGISKVVTWSIPACEATDTAWLEGRA